MIVNLDSLIFSLQHAGGISAYWSEILKRFDENVNFCIFGSDSDNVFAKEICNYRPTFESEMPVNIRRYLPFLKKLADESIFHSSYYRVSMQPNVANVTTVHDFTYEYYMKGLSRFVHSAQKKFAIKNSEGIICVSENTKLDLIKFYPDIDESKIKVIYNGVSDKFDRIIDAKAMLSELFPELLHEQYIIFVGDRSPYKNFDKAVDVLKKLPTFQMVVVGGKLFSEDEQAIVDSLEGRLFHYRGISTELLNVLYNNAFCLLYPSDYEGFGIPVLEAMKSGCPVISTNKSSIPEVAGVAGLLVDETSTNKFLIEIAKLSNTDFRERLQDEGFAQAAKFSWDKCFEETVSFYQEIYKRKFG